MQKKNPSASGDALLLLATAAAAKRRPAALAEIIAAIDLLQGGSLPGENRLSQAFARLTGLGLLLAGDEGFALSPEAEALVGELPRKAEPEAKLQALERRLADWPAAPGAQVVEVPGSAILPLILAHRASARDGVKNLLMPKPKPAEDKPRPGQRQRRPFPPGKPRRRP